MLNEQICKKCIRQWFDNRVIKPNESKYPNDLLKHKKNYGRWFKKVLLRTHGRIPCPYLPATGIDIMVTGEFFYSSLNLWYTYTPRTEIFPECLYILEHTVQDNAK
jgi:hypothetical protein